MTNKKHYAKNANEILDRHNPPTKEDVSQRTTFRDAMFIAELIYEVRTEAGLSQREFAKRIDTTASVICKLENADYDGHTMKSLRKIAAAVGKTVQIRFVPNNHSGKVV
ncbi:MAG: helix-turn-helix transcriptional regulator [Phycisphaerales bacterium]|jgi:ribosome-binding protein aMBF1 (putative translation factor)|nr:helix-turn-helix transcriptional regulator [Phycisphaerales bacterium]